MKAAVINFSGNVGKSTVATHLLMPRIKDAEFFAIESINSDEGQEGEKLRGKQFGQLIEYIMTIDAAVVDIGASNVEEFAKLMHQYRGSHEEFDYFVVPVVKDGKQQRDTVATIQDLAKMGIPAKKIRVVFNMLGVDETIERAFAPMLAFYEAEKRFTLKPKAVLYASDIYQGLRALNISVTDLLNDPTDYRALQREAKTQEEKAKIAGMRSLKLLAISAQENLDEVFTALFSK